MSEASGRISLALEYAENVESGHRKQWVIDQMVRALTGCPMVVKTKNDWRGEPYTFEAQGESEEYLAFVATEKDGEDGPDTYEWDEGIAP